MQVNRDDLAFVLSQSYLFHSLDLKQISYLIKYSEVVSFEKNQMIYLENSMADSISVVLEGKVELLKEVNYSLERVNILQISDIFGLDLLDANGKSC